MKKTKSAKIFSVISLLLLLSFTSCNNVFENSVSSEDNTSQQNEAPKTAGKSKPAGNSSSTDQETTIKFGGSLKLSGAVPAEFLPANANESAENQQGNRSATAQLPSGSDYEYYVTATSNDGLVHEDVIASGSSTISYTLQLEVRKTWTLQAGFRKKASGTPGTDGYIAPKNLLIDIDTDAKKSFSVNLTDSLLEKEHTFYLKPLQTANGKGTIDLSMDTSEATGITALKLFITDEDGLSQEWNPSELDISPSQIKTKENQSIASGSYDLTMIFYKGDFQAYITYQIINVFDNMKTTLWVSGNASDSDSIIDGGTFKLKDSLLQKFASSTIYVGVPTGIAAEAKDENPGSPYAPLKTLNQAFNLIQANPSGDGNTRDYRILVTTAKPAADKAAQPQKANLEIPAEITSGDSGNAKSIEIVGIGSDPELRPAESNPGTVLTVNTTVPVKLSNIKITGGQGNSGKGGALSITKDGASVTLGSGTKITANTASSLGGGIYIKGTATNNKPKLIIKNGAEIKSNAIGTSGTGGMAIYADCAEVEMTGGEISGNSKSGGDYGAVRLEKQSVFTMTGGTVSGNEGGAFYVGSSYESNTYKHSVLKIGGTAVITPVLVSGKAQTRKNDVFIQHAYPEGQQDGGEYSPVEITSSGISSSGVVAALSPQDWQRGLDILAADNGDINNYKDYFMLTDSDFNFTKSGSQESIAKLKAPIYIKADGSDSPSASGTKNHPYKTLQYAAASLAGGEPDTILVIGKVSQQTVPSALISTKCSALTIKGVVDENDSTNTPEINANGANISALTFDTEVPVTIENLKITGGLGTEESSSTYGGGIYLKSGTLKLADGAVVTGNQARYGGGVYVKKGASLFMYGSALIGDPTESPATGEEVTGTTWTNCANYASFEGGGIFNAGSVYLGYKGKVGDTLETADFTGGVKRNLSHSGGGGIDSNGTGSNDRSVLKIRAGKVSYNKAVNVAGGIRAYRSDVEILGGEISYNQGESGGGLAVSTDANVNFSGGTINENTATTTAENAGGGAVKVSEGDTTSFTMSGSASIPYGVHESGVLVKGRCKNDVYLPCMINSNGDITKQAFIKVGSNLSENAATISFWKWRRGVQFLQVGGTLTALPDGVEDKFAFTELGWDKVRYTKTNNNDAVKIDADIYVAGSNPAKCSAPSDTGNTIGNWAHPFASISAATALVDASHSTIIVDGSLGAQAIGGTGSLSSMTIKGYKTGSTGTSAAKIDAGNTSGSRPLTVNASGKTITIEDLTITGGNATTNGGGVCISGGTLKLGNGAKITGNYTTLYGGGIYLASGTKLFMYGSSIVGDRIEATATSSTRTTSGSTGCANAAKSGGGGIYNDGGAIYIGYSDTGDSNKSDMASGYGVCRNFSEETYGGGICNRKGTLLIASGSVSYNQCVGGNGTAGSGGGIFNAYDSGITTSLTIEAPATTANKLVMYGNKAVTGGAICNNTNGVITINAGQIGGSETNQQNTATTKGGAIYHGGNTLSVSGKALIYTGIEKTNDVYLPAGNESIAYCVTAGAIDSNGNTDSQKMSLTLAEYKRGTKIVLGGSGVTVNADFWKKFALTSDDEGWTKDKISVSSNNYVYITSPIYVVGASGTGSTKPDGFEYGTSDANGTKTSPYASIADALTCADLATVKEITIAGTLVGAQQVISGPSVDITLKGYKAAGAATSDAKIQRFSTRYTTNKTDGSALTVNASGKTVTITDLTITYGAALSGAGIYITAGTVKLGDYAKINDNYAANSGGGVYVNTGATFFMYGKALIGDKLSTDAGIKVAGTDGSNDYANWAKNAGGGGIYNGGAAYIGYSGFDTDGTTLIASSIDNGYGIIRNYNTSEGGGAIHNAGTLKIGSGSISYNKGSTGGAVKCTADATISGGTFTANNASSGGAIYINASKTVTIDGSATFTKNQADYGGAIEIDNAGTLNMSAGTIGANGALNTANTKGGAIFQNGTFNISGSAYVYSGSEKTNDVYLTTGKYVTVNGSWSGSQSSSSQMALTPVSWTRGMAVVTKGSSSSAVDITTDIVSKFCGSDSEWSAVLTGSGASARGRLDADIYVAGSDPQTVSGVSYGVGKTISDGGRGTKTLPYSTISEAVAQCWGGPKDKGTGVSRTINIVGTITGAQEIASTVTTSKASGITLKGINTDATLNGGMSSTSATKKSTLTISTAVPVTIQTLTVKGGYSSGNGGGILVNGVKGASLTLGTGAVITGNTATTSGGGIYFAGTSASGGTANLIMNSSSQISGNTASGTGTTDGGGGVYAKYANVYISGSALIGDTDATYTTGASSTSKSNSAASGGGIYAESSNLYMGYASSSSTGADLDSNYGVCHNYASANGGGIYIDSSSALYMGSGKISKNGAATYGGGIYNLGNVFLHTNALVGDASSSTADNTANSNQAGSNTTGTVAGGGGIYSAATGTNGVYLGYKSSSAEQALNTRKGVIGNSMSNKIDSCGGSGIYCASGIVKMASGEVSYNGTTTSSSYYTYGGICVDGGTFTMDEGIVAKNYGYYGGGVCVKSGTFTMNGGTIGDSSLSDAPAANKESNAAVLGGGVYVLSGATANLNEGIIAGNYAKHSSQGGGGMYVAGTATVKNTIRYNVITGTGNGIYCASDNCSIEGATFTKNRIYVASGKTLQLKSISCTNTVNSDIQLASTTSFVNVTAALTGSGRVATIAPYTYATTTQVLKAKSGVTLADQTGRFAILPNSGAQWSVSTTGYLAQGILPSGMAAFLDTLPAGTDAEPNNLKINVASDDDILAVRDAIKNGKKYVNVTFASTSITTIPSQAFQQCTYLAGITLPSGITELGTSCFDSCYNLKTLNLPEGITSLPMYFMSSTAIESIQIPASLTTFDDWALYGAHSSLTQITVAAGNTNFKSVDGVLFSYDGKSLWWYPKGRTGSYTIPSGTEKLTGYCFEEAKLTSVTIPASVTSMVYRAFYRSKVATVNYNGTKEQWNNISGIGTTTQVWSSVPATSVTCTNGTVTLNKP